MTGRWGSCRSTLSGKVGGLVSGSFDDSAQLVFGDADSAFSDQDRANLARPDEFVRACSSR